MSIYVTHVNTNFINVRTYAHHVSSDLSFVGQDIDLILGYSLFEVSDVTLSHIDTAIESIDPLRESRVVLNLLLEVFDNFGNIRSKSFDF